MNLPHGLDDLFFPPIQPAIKNGTLGEGSAANVNGQTYAKAPRVAGGRAPAGANAILARNAVGSGYSVIGTGGYYAPRTQRIPTPEP